MRRKLKTVAGLYDLIVQCARATHNDKCARPFLLCQPTLDVFKTNKGKGGGVKSSRKASK